MDARDLTDWTPLAIAARYGHLEVVRVLLEAGAAPDASTVQGWSPFLLAMVSRFQLVSSNNADGFWLPPPTPARAEHAEVMHLLVAGGADVDRPGSSGWTPLAIAACIGSANAVRSLLMLGAKLTPAHPGEPFALHYATAEGQAAVVQVLLEAGHDPNVVWSGVTPLVQAVNLGREDLVSLLLAAGADIDMQIAQEYYSAVTLAVARGHAPVVALLADAGANLAAPASPEEYSLLHLAALHGHASVLSALLDRVESPDPVDSYGRTPLSYAAHWGHAPVVRRLVEAGADWRRPDTAGYGPLSAAVFAGRTEVVQELLTLGADPWDRDAHAWMAAAWVGNLALVRLFVQHGGDKDYLDPDGDTALLLAKRHRHKRVVQYLRSVGARE